MANKIKNQSGYSFQILQEEASDLDLFADKTHEEVKNTIFNLIEASEKGVTIGLEGSWGSGKTTVINLLSTEVEKSNTNTLFFSFDAWAHEGDPLRRIFLESLINKINPDRKDSLLNNLAKEISGRKKTVTVTAKKQTSKFADYLSISALFVPAGAGILAAIDYDRLLFPWHQLAKSANFAFIFGLLLSLLPILVLIYWWKLGDKDEKGNTDWGLILSKSTENYTQDITEDGERSSIEFENYFKKILEHSVGDSKNKQYERAIVVIDNLDRVDVDHAKQLWSTLQTFFQHRSIKRNEKVVWKERLWFIIPYDKEGLSKIWATHSNDSRAELNETVAKSFLNKCFQIIAEVPAPVMSAWNEYTIYSVNQALVGWPQDEKDNVIRTYKRHASRLDISPTPREINSFVNQVGFLGMRWGGVMLAESIALYSILRKSYSESSLRQTLISSTALPDKFESVADTQEIKQELAGLLFGVSKRKGVELLLTPEIESAIRSGDGEILKNLISTHGEAFWISWDAKKIEILPTSSHSEEYRISATLAIRTGLNDHFKRLKQELADIEKVWKETTHNWQFDRLNYTEALTAVADFSQENTNYFDWLHQVISDKLLQIIDAVKSNPEINAKGLEQIASLAILLSKSFKPLQSLHYLSLDSNNWAIWLNTLIETNISLPNVLPAKGIIKEIGALYLENGTTLPEDNLLLLLNTFKVFPTSPEWESVINNLTIWGNRTNRELNNDLAYKLMLNLYAYKNGAFQDQIQSCIKGPHFWTRGMQENIEQAPTLPILVGCVLGKELQDINLVNANVHAYWSQKEASVDILKQAFLTLDDANLLKALWEIAQDERNSFAISLLTANINNTNLYSLKEATLCLNNYYKWFEEDQHKNIILALCDHGSAERALETIKINPIDFDYALYLLQSHGNHSVKNHVNKLLASIESKIWEKCFVDNSYLLNCALHETLKLNHKYTEAFKKFYLEIVNLPSTGHLWQWENFNALLEKTVDRSLLLDDLSAKHFEDDKDKVDDLIFSVTSPHILDRIHTVSEDRLMLRICDWIDSKKWDRLNWLNSSKFTIKKPVLEGLISRIHDTLNNIEDDEIKATTQTLAKKLKIDI